VPVFPKCVLVAILAVVLAFMLGFIITGTGRGAFLTYGLGWLLHHQPGAGSRRSMPYEHGSSRAARIMTH